MTLRNRVCVLAMVLTLCAGVCPRDTKEHGSVIVLRALASGLDLHHARAGMYPGSLDEICRPGAGCPGFPDAASLRDEWDRRIVYTARDGSFELRSVGRDGRAGTADDLTFSPEAERRRRALFAGCYSLSPPLPGASTERLRLDTLAGTSAWGLMVGPKDDWRDAEWFPLRDSVSVLVRQDNPHRHTVIELRAESGGLAGEQLSGGDATFSARREACSGVS